MINVQRNFFIENILYEAEFDYNIDFKKIPYTDNILSFDNDYISFIFLDIDRVRNINFIKNDFKLKEKKKI